ncbi:MAG TPA: hypothetical protein VN822_06000 [Candidatus Acidoferrales bacterium]|nr:hypothetical protein [Candidatus Acidoferrales bacterium]
MTTFLILLLSSLLAGLFATAIIWPVLWVFGVFQKPAWALRIQAHVNSVFSPDIVIKPRT